jgi:hypothetical protein
MGTGDLPAHVAQRLQLVAGQCATAMKRQGRALRHRPCRQRLRGGSNVGIGHCQQPDVCRGQFSQCGAGLASADERHRLSGRIGSTRQHALQLKNACRLKQPPQRLTHPAGTNQVQGPHDGFK